MTYRNALVGLGALALSALLFGAHALVSDADAQAQDVVWYRVINQGRSAGTMAEWRRLGRGYGGTFPFVDDFEVQIRPEGATAATVEIRDRGARTRMPVDCTAPRNPRRGALMYRRDGEDRPGDDRPTIVVAVACSAERPEAR